MQMNKKTKDRITLFFPALLTVLLLLAVYMIKGVYPFGGSNVSYYDMNQMYIPLFARNYHILHGNDTVVFDWLAGAGMDMSSSYQAYMLDPVNLLSMFIRPERLLDLMSLFVLVKLVFVSLSILFFLKKEYKLRPLLHISLCMVYTFSGYVLQYYTNIMFLTTLAVFPLLILALKHLLSSGKALPFFLLLSFQLMTEPYLAVMVLIYLVVYSFCLSLTESDKTKRRVFCARLGITTFLSLAVSAAAWLPAVMKWTVISRTNSSSKTGLLSLLRSPQCTQPGVKAFVFFNLELAVVLGAIAVWRAVSRKEKMSSRTAFLLFMFLMMLMPILNEGSNLIWHLGSYAQFPYRNGFMLTFSAIELIAHQWQKTDDSLPPDGSPIAKSIAVTLAAAAFGCVSLILSIRMDITFYKYGIHQDMGSYKNYGLIVILNIVLFFILVCFVRGRLREVLVSVMLTAQLSLAAVCFMAPTQYAKRTELEYYLTRDDYLNDCAEIKDSTELENDGLSRVKLLYPALSRNYSVMLDVPSISQWLSEATDDFQKEIKRMGYAVTFTSNHDNGGTLFSDALLNNKKVITYSDVSVPGKAYEKSAEAGDYTIYDMNYSLPFGLLVDESILDANCKDKTPAEYQMYLADIFAKDKNLFTSFDHTAAQRIENEKNRTDEYDLHIESDSLVYIYSKKKCKVSVNEEQIVFPYYDDTDNKKTTKGINLVGEYQAGEDIKLCVTAKEEALDSTEILILDLGAMAELSQEYQNKCTASITVDQNDLHITAETEEECWMFLPMEYLEGWKAQVNGTDAEVSPVMNGAFMAVKLPKGSCKIDMSYFPPYLKSGLIISAAGAALACLVFIMKKRGKDAALVPFVSKAAFITLAVAAAGIIVITVILPVFI